MRRYRLHILLTMLLFGSAMSHGVPAYISFPADVDWVTRDSEHFRILYRKGETDFARRALISAEKAYRLLHPIFQEGPEMTWIVLADFNDSTNGYSLDLPWPHIVLFAVPPDPSSELAWMDGWLDSLVLHEYVHTLHIYPAHGLWKPARTILGSWILPNGLLPMHFHEGLAVLFETELTLGGRGHGPYFNMMRRMAVDAGNWNRDAHPLDRMDGTVELWPEGASPYYYGYYMYKELYDRKGKPGIHDLVQSYSSNWPWFFQDGPLEEVYGQDYGQLWDEIFSKTTASEKKQIAAIKETPLSPLKYLTDSRFGKEDIAISPDGQKAIYRKGVPKDGGSFEELDLKTGKVIDNLVFHAGAVNGMCWGKTPKGERLLFLRAVGDGFYLNNQIALFDFKTKKQYVVGKRDEEPIKHLRLLACSPSLDRLLLYREHAGKGQVEVLRLVREDEAKQLVYASLERSWDLPVGSWISGLVEGKPDWIALRQGVTTMLYRWDPGVMTPTPVIELNTHAYNFRPGKSPGELYALASFDGRDEIWSIDTNHRTMRKAVGLLGGADSFARTGNDFVVVSYRDGGYDIARAGALSASDETARPITPPPPLPIRSDPPPKLAEEESYSPLSTLYPHMWFPSLLFVPDGFQLGAYIPGFDVAQKHLYDLTGGYDSRGQVFAIGDYAYRLSNQFLLTTTADYLPSYIYTSKAFLKIWGASAGVEWEVQPPPMPPYAGNGTHVVLSGIFQRKESSDLFGEANQGVGVSLALTKDWNLYQLPYDFYPRSGTSFSLVHNQFLQAMGSTDNYFTTTLGIDQYIGAPWGGGHVLYLGLRAGYTQGTGIFNSYFQAGGDILFYQYREYFLNRGFEYVAFPFSRRIANLNVEYRFPLWRVERGLGLWPLFLRGIHMALVSDTTTRDLGTENSEDYANPNSNYTAQNTIFQRYFVSVGAELKTDWKVSYYLPGQLVIGAYHGFGPLGQDLYVTVGINAEI